MSLKSFFHGIASLLPFRQIESPGTRQFRGFIPDLDEDEGEFDRRALQSD